ncbi:UNVERIFIED_ORG: hypothetical protein ABIC48_001644 [Burkholderia territorii]
MLALAREAGLLVTLDGQIGREKYQSVAGSVLALQRFAAALSARNAADAPAASEPVARRAPAGRMRIVCAAAHAAHVRRSMSCVRMHGCVAARAAGTTCDRFFAPSDLRTSPTHGTEPCIGRASRHARHAAPILHAPCPQPVSR